MQFTANKVLKVFTAAVLATEVLSAQAALIWQDTGDVAATNSAFAWGAHSSAWQASLSPLPAGMGTLSPDTVSALAVSPTSVQSAIGFHFYPSASGGEADAEQRFTFTNKGANPTANYKDLWIHYKLYVPSNYYHRNNGGHNNNKFLWLWSGDYNSPGGNNDYFGYQYVVLGTYPSSRGDGSSALEIGWTAATLGHQSLGPTRRNPNDADIYNTYSGPEVVIIDRKTDLNSWIDLVVHVTAATYHTPGAYPDNAGGDGVLEVWKNGTKIWNVHNMGNYYYDPAHPEYSGFQTGYFLGYANSGFDQDTYMYVDGATFGTTAADVGFNVNAVSPPSAPSSIKAVQQ